jgi:DNA topoisomerase-1
MSENLVIVESPAKARTISRILGNSFSLKASMGHIRDLPKSRLGVDEKNNFAPQYSIPRDKSKIVRELKEAVKEAKTVYLATDPDREGEAISWHILEVTRSDSKDYKRVVFHEITEEAIKQAFQHSRAIDMNLVNAQQARRVLDRLVGYKISPLLWKKVRRGLSAGRVQSVALKIIVDREREIQKFKPVEYWSIEAELAKKLAAPGDRSFRAVLLSLIGGKKIEIHIQEEADSFAATLKKADYSVLKVLTKKVPRQPAPPFITSTLQQEAYRKLHMSAQQTMIVAQQLYEGLSVGKEGNVGLITYMRTDSTQVAAQAVNETRDFIAEKYGKEYLPERARAFLRRVKGAQEAHEAIRPTSTKREPALVKSYLTSQQFRLYELIWKRMVASQMAAMVSNITTADIKAKAMSSRDEYLFRATSSVTHFAGFTILYIEGKDTDEEKEKESSPLPGLKAGDALNLLKLFPQQHSTQPPLRFTDATLVKFLESEGIGRPSTYAPILSVIQVRDYVRKERGSLIPTELGFTVGDLMAQYFPGIVDIKFTAHMENELDEIATEDRDWVDVVREFNTPLDKYLAGASQMERVKIADEQLNEACPECGKPLLIKTGRFGKFITCSGYPECKYHRSIQVKLNVPCPECKKGEVVQRRSKKKGKTFYGCSLYPDCKWVSNYRPVPQPCPECGGMMEIHGKQVKCTKCDYRGKIEEKEAEKAEIKT